MVDLDQDLKNISLHSILNTIEREKDPKIKELLRKIKSEKLITQNSNLNERIRAVPDFKISFNGFINYNKSIENSLIKKSIVLKRSYAEYDNRYRQLVSNVILETVNEEGERMFGFLKRENFYKNELSIHGAISMIGGHVNADDKDLKSALERELLEEVTRFDYDSLNIKPIGFIKEISDTISSNHLCVLFVLKLKEIASDSIRSKENKQTFLWISESECKQQFANNFKNYDYDFDSWAKIAIANYIYCQ